MTAHVMQNLTKKSCYFVWIIKGSYASSDIEHEIFFF